jgi:hypothetical protein
VIRFLRHTKLFASFLCNNKMKLNFCHGLEAEFLVISFFEFSTSNFTVSTIRFCFMVLASKNNQFQEQECATVSECSPRLKIRSSLRKSTFHEGYISHS